MDFRTDFADERIRIIDKSNKIDGIEIDNERLSESLSINRIKVLNEKGSKLIDKKVGDYITINIEDLDIIDEQGINAIKKLLQKELKKLIKTKGPVLIVGLGNEDTTADSIGPKVIKDLEITRHIIKYRPDLIDENKREISAIAPGVLGQTGIETQEIISGILEKIDVSAIVVIDALASNNIARLLRTIQLTNTGISPGSGVNNKRKEISKDTMGVPVIAIGVPTVVEAATIIADSFNIFQERFKEFKFLEESSFEDKYELVKTVLDISKYNLAVMPKEIDSLVDNLKEIISYGINQALN